jgi:hypothetical protein
VTGTSWFRATLLLPCPPRLCPFAVVSQSAIEQPADGFRSGRLVILPFDPRVEAPELIGL